MAAPLALLETDLAPPPVPANVAVALARLRSSSNAAARRACPAGYGSAENRLRAFTAAPAAPSGLRQSGSIPLLKAAEKPVASVAGVP